MEAAKKECILKEAARAFAKLGFRKASVDEIARGAGVAKGTVYLAAKSKEDLFFQVLHREIRAWVAEMAKRVDPRVPADELLAILSAESLRYLEEKPLLQDLLFGKTHEVVPALSEQWSSLRDLGNANIVEVLKLGIRQKRFRADLDVEALAALLGDLQLTGYALMRSRPEDRAAKLEQRFRVGMDLVLHGVLRSPRT